MKKPNLNIKGAARHLGRNVQVNSPTILSAVAVVGVAATAYFAVKAGMESQKVIEDDRYAESIRREGVLKPVERTKSEKALLVWKLYIPAVVTGASTIACIVASNRIQARRMAAMLAAYGVLSGDFDDYKEKAQELLGVKKSAELSEERVRTSMDQVAAPNGIPLENGKSWFYDMSTRNYILTTREKVEKAVNEVNFRIIESGDASLNDFYAELGVETIGIGESLGWNRKNKCELKFTPVESDDRGAVTAFEFRRGPLPNFSHKGPIDVSHLPEVSE